MNQYAKLITGLLLLLSLHAAAQDDKRKPPVTVGGDMGVWYEGYGLDKSPEQPVPDFYRPRKPWNMLRYSFNPIFNIGKWSIPFNFNFSSSQNNFTTPSGGGSQSLWQFLTNPANNFGISPKIGTTEILLGTQTLKYSDLSTGDVGVFGYGVNLSPGKFRLRLFQGVSQRPVNYEAPTIGPPANPGVIGAYQRNQWMAQFGLAKEGTYFAGFNIVRSSDQISSVSSPPLTPIDPQQNVVISFLTDAITANGWNYHLELGQSFFTRDLNTPLSTIPVKDFQPFLNSRTSTGKDNAVMLGISKKGKDWEAGAKVNYYGAGYYTAGYPFMNNDKIEYLGNTHFNTWKKKINIVASLGDRLGNLSHTSGTGTTSQLIANINAYTQFTDKFSLNLNFNNFGFNSSDITGYKSVSNELSINPAYTWTSATMSQLLSATYTRSKYDETTIIPATTTHNDTQTALLLYVPTFFNKSISPDFSLMWFRNTAPLVDLTLLSATGGMTWKTGKKISLKGQLQYDLSTTNPFTADKNLLVTGGFDWALYKKLKWQLTVTANVYSYGSALPGSSLAPVYIGDPRYLESNLRTGLQYRF
ncbi:MAG: hypothetical protein V4592_10085 [Bacteroidota bacterium]